VGVRVGVGAGVGVGDATRWDGLGKPGSRNLTRETGLGKPDADAVEGD